MPSVTVYTSAVAKFWFFFNVPWWLSFSAFVPEDLPLEDEEEPYMREGKSFLWSMVSYTKKYNK